MIEALAILKAAHDTANASEDDLEPAVCSLYKAIVEHMVRGGIRFYKHSLINRNIWRAYPMYQLVLQTL